MSIRRCFAVALGCIVIGAVAYPAPPAFAAQPKPAAKTPELTAEQQAQLDEATKLLQQVVELHRQGRVRDAIAPAKKALAIHKEVLGEKHLHTALSLYNLGILLQTMGDYAAARPYCEQALAINREVLGPKHPDTAESLIHLGSLLSAMGDYAAARPYYEQALAIRREVLGQKNLSTAQSLNNLGFLLGKMGD